MRKVDVKNVNQNIEFENKFKEIHIDDIVIESSQMRKFEVNDKFDELVKSIGNVGLINPITVYKDGKKYCLIAGLRRIKAHERLGIIHIQCNIVDADKKKSLIMQYEENIVRDDVNVIDEGEYLKYCKVKLSYSNQKIAAMLNRSESYIGKRIFMTEQNDLIIDAVKEKRISFNAGIIISQCKDIEKIKYLIEYFESTKLRDNDLQIFVKQIVSDLEYQSGKEVNDGPESKVYPILYSEPKGVCDVCNNIKPLIEITSIRICKECSVKEE